MSELMKERIDVPCPKPGCNRKIRVSLGDVKAQRTVTCAGGHRVKLIDKEGGVRSVDQSMNDLQRSFDKLNRELRF